MGTGTDFYADLSIGVTVTDPENELLDDDQSSIRWIFGQQDTSEASNSELSRIIDLKADPKEAAFVVLRYSCRYNTDYTKCRKIYPEFIACYSGELVDYSVFDDDT